MSDSQGKIVGPGVYQSMPAMQYHALDGASNSRLTQLMRSPAHLKAYLSEPGKDTTALRIGRAAHSAILEPDDFDASFTLADRCQAIKKDKEQCNNTGIAFHSDLGWLCGVHAKGAPGEFDQRRIIVPPGDYAMCVEMRDSVLASASARGLLAGDGDVELTLIWNDLVSGVRCKGRLDRYAPLVSSGCIVDVKTTRDASRREFERSIFAHGYHRQGALYLEGAKANGLSAEHFVIIAVEKEPPYAVAVYRLTEGAIDAGREQVAPLLARYAECVERNEWPSYPDEVQDIALPHYAWAQIDEELSGAAA